MVEKPRRSTARFLWDVELSMGKLNLDLSLGARTEKLKDKFRRRVVDVQANHSRLVSSRTP